MTEPFSLQEYFAETKVHLAALGDDELLDCLNRQVGNGGWVSARGAYLVALRSELETRFDFSELVHDLNYRAGHEYFLEGRSLREREVPVVS